MDFNVEYVDGKDFKYPSILYKYRDWSDPNHRRIIMENSVFFSSPRGFEDILDCNVPEKFPTKEELFLIFLKKSKTDNSNLKPIQHRAFARYWSRFSPLANPIELEKQINYINSLFNSRFGVLSVTANPENEKMWEQYGNYHKGFCVGFDTAKLFEIVGGGGEVIYEDVLPIIDFINDDFTTKHIKNIFYKKKEWEYEQEYRLHKMWDRDMTDSDRNIALLKDCIVEVILGKDMSEDDCIEITKIVEDLHPQAKIRKLR